MIWASPPCTEYSTARVRASTPRDFIGADQLVQQAIKVIEYVQPTFWFIENPCGGMLRRRPVVSMLPPPKKVSYCRYDAPYQKNTAIWTNTSIEFQFCQWDCNATVVGEKRRKRHLGTALRGPGKYGTQGYPLSTLHSIPPLLCRHICHYVDNYINGENQRDIRGTQLPRSRAPEESAGEQRNPTHEGASG